MSDVPRPYWVRDGDVWAFYACNEGQKIAGGGTAMLKVRYRAGLWEVDSPNLGRSTVVGHPSDGIEKIRGIAVAYLCFWLGQAAMASSDAEVKP